MTSIRVEFLFQVSSPPAQLPVTKDALGKSYAFSHEGMPVEITIPQGVNDFLFWQPFVPGEYRAIFDVDSLEEVHVQVIRVTVIIDADVSAATVTIDNPDALDRAVEAIDRARDVASQVITDFVAWVRATTRLTDLALSSEVPPLAGPVRAFEADTGIQFKVGPSIRSVGVGRDPAGRYRLTVADLTEIIERVNRGDEAPIAETLLADAEHYARHAVRDFRRAVLMAAIACEVKVKEILRERATKAQRSLVDFALENPREITLTAADGLFNKLIFATLGRSLRQDDRQLFRDIEALYTARNRIAHRGLMPDEAEAGRVVRAARRSFTWLDSLPQPGAAEGGPEGPVPERIEIRLTQGNLNNDHISVRKHLTFFPKDAIGPPNKRQGRGALLTLHFEGLPEPVETDIADNKDKKIFRCRGEVRKFFRQHHLREGDSVVIERLSRYEYRIVPAR
jgi:hypothetical protein